MAWLIDLYLSMPSPVFMALALLILWLLCWGIVAGVREVAFRIGWWASYRYGRNPYTRVCRACGQRQDCYAYPGGVLRWEPMGAAIKNENCACHR